MKVKLSDTLTGRLLLECIYPKDFDNGLNIEEREYDIASTDYSINIKEQWFYGACISFSKVNTSNEGLIFLESTTSNVSFLFCLDGNIKCKDSFQSEIITLKKNQQWITIGGFNNLSVKLDSNTEYIYIQITEQHYKNLTGNDFASDKSIYESLKIEPEVNLILNSIIHQKNHKRIRKISVESKIYQLLAFYINKENSRSRSSLKKHDFDKILYAKELVERNLQSPKSLIELSREAGINDNKLKIGFKELTGCTVFGYLNKLRMEKAYHYLSNEKKNVNEVAFLVGYKNAQHFTAAFKKIYNILPGSLNKDKFLHAKV